MSKPMDVSTGLIESRLRRIASDLRTVQDDLQGILPELRQRVLIRLSTALHKEQQYLRQLTENIEQCTDLQSAWAEIHHFEARLNALYEECLSLIEGSRVREMPGPGRFCALADALADDILSRTDIDWKSFTVPATSEFFAGSSRVIRVRYPSMSIWDLPVVAHELAHFVGPQLSAYRGSEVFRPFEDLLTKARSAEGGDAGLPSDWGFLHEFFADMFAAHVVGPAYLFTCTELRFDPVGAHVSYGMHPAASHRIEAIRDTLARSGNVKSIENPSSRYIDQALSEWSEAVIAAGGQAAGASAPNPVSSWQPRIFSIFDDYVPFAEYADSHRAFWLAGVLTDDLSRGWEVESITAKLGASMDPAIGAVDLINAAWFARLMSPPNEESIRRVIETCLERLISPPAKLASKRPSKKG